MERYMQYPPGGTAADHLREQAEELVPIGDEEAGGIVAYALPDHAETVVRRLNRGGGL